MRKLVNPHQKAKLALVAMKGDKTFNELASEHQVHPSQIWEWKKLLEKESHLLFKPNNKSKEEHKIAELAGTKTDLFSGFTTTNVALDEILDNYMPL